MNYENARQESTTVIQNVLTKHKDENISRVILNLANEGKLTQLTAQQIENNEIDALNSLTEFQLCLVYKRLKEYIDNMPEISKYFTEIEIIRCEHLIEKDIKDKFPFEFNNCRKIMPNMEVYRCDVSYKDLYYFLTSGAVKVEEGFQRESEYTVFKGKVISNVKFNKNVPPKIAECILKNEFFPTDEFKFHLLNDGEDYFEIVNENKLVIHSGNIKMLDGQHRSRGIQMAFAQNHNIDLTFSFIFSYGSKEMAQNLLAQHELRQPINAKTISNYIDSDANDIFRRFSTDTEIQKSYNFIEDKSAIIAGLGFIYKSDIISAIESYYVKKDMLRQEKNSIAKWLADFFKLLLEEWELDFIDYQNTSKTQWNTNSFAYDGLIYLSSRLYEQESRGLLALSYIEKLQNLNLSVNDIKGKNKSKAFKKIVEEVLNNE